MRTPLCYPLPEMPIGLAVLGFSHCGRRAYGKVLPAFPVDGQ